MVMPGCRLHEGERLRRARAAAFATARLCAARLRVPSALPAAPSPSPGRQPLFGFGFRTARADPVRDGRGLFCEPLCGRFGVRLWARLCGGRGGRGGRPAQAVERGDGGLQALVLLHQRLQLAQPIGDLLVLLVEKVGHVRILFTRIDVMYITWLLAFTLQQSQVVAPSRKHLCQCGRPRFISVEVPAVRSGL